MATEKQIVANRENAQKSTGPEECSQTRFNAVKYGLTGECVYSEEEQKAILKIYDDLCTVFEPKSLIIQILLSRAAKLVWKLQKVDCLQAAHMHNSLIRQSNRKSDPMTKILESGVLENPNKRDEYTIEHLNEEFDLLARYEVSIENRLIKLIKYLTTGDI